MKKRFFAIILALTLCAGLVTPAFAEDTESVTVAGITFDAIATGQHESYRDFLEEYVAEGYSWAPAQLAAAGPEVDLLYNLGLINYGPEDGVRNIWAYLVDDDVTLDFHVKEGDKITIEGYYLSIDEHKAVDEPVYVATSMGSWTFPAKKDGALVDKDFFDQNYPGVNYIYCYRGDYNPNIDEEETLSIVFADENAAPRTVPAFSDVAANAYYAVPVAWAVGKEITTGTGNNKFSPDQDCTNAQILTFIWRAYGKPEPTIDNPFTNSIPDGYKKAAVWAHEKGMVSGTTFDTDKPCTRAMAMTYLWQAAGSPTAPAVSFTDVPAGAAYAQAVAWAVEQKITTGTSATTFSPDDICNRGQIVTFLHRAFASATPKASEDLSAVDFSAEYMSSPYYDALQKVVLTGNYRQDILAVASSQIGYSEGDTKDQLSGSYHGSGDYTEYGRYLDSNGSAWCSEFASWCARVAKVPTNILHNSKSANVEKFAAPYYTWSQSVYAGGTYTPQPGDLALFAWHGTSPTENHLSHTAIVYDVKTSGNKVEITVIHGNSNNSVAMSTYTANASSGEVSKGYLVYFVAPEYDA